jgi:methylmalonyl-CoA mutase
MEQSNDRLFEGFPPVTPAEWEAKIQEDLKGADYEKKLIWKTLEGFRVKPYYTADDLKALSYLQQEPGAFPFVRSNKSGSNAWEIRQDFRVTDAETAAAKAALAVRGGADAIGFDLRGATNTDMAGLKQLVSGIDNSKVSLHLITGDDGPALLDHLVQYLEERGSAKISGSLCFDPMGQLAVTGAFFRSEADDFSRLDKVLLTAENELDGFRVLPVSSYLFGNAGATAVQELAFGLAMAAEYFDRLTASGHTPAEVARHIQWNLGSGSGYFMEIAKVRAARLLFSHLAEAYGEKPEASVFIHSITTSWNKTLYDPHVNMLRLTTEAMAAVLGGCDSLLVNPFDAAFRAPGDFSERIARNTQIILKEESYLDKVVDPAAGSYYIESLTDSLVEHAWNRFLQIADTGGFVAAMKAGTLQQEVAATAQQRRQMVASRREILLGTNQYPNTPEAAGDSFDPELAWPKPQTAAKPVAEPLSFGRAAEDFERLRLASEKHPGGRPSAFMLTYGNLAMRLARAQFSGNFFACAGYKVTDNLGFSSAADGVKAALDAKADIIVVCSSDEEYATLAPEVKRLAGGKALIVIAGAPACMEELKSQGIQDFIHVRSNVLETLQQFSRKLGIHI